jgi:hypothetical protein
MRVSNKTGSAKAPRGRYSNRLREMNDAISQRLLLAFATLQPKDRALNEADYQEVCAVSNESSVEILCGHLE